MEPIVIEMLTAPLLPTQPPNPIGLSLPFTWLIISLSLLDANTTRCVAYNDCERTMKYCCPSTYWQQSIISCFDGTNIEFKIDSTAS